MSMTITLQSQHRVQSQFLLVRIPAATPLFELSIPILGNVWKISRFVENIRGKIIKQISGLGIVSTVK